MGRLFINGEEVSITKFASDVVSRTQISDIKNEVYNTINRNKSISDKRDWCNKSHNRKSSRKWR